VWWTPTNLTLKGAAGATAQGVYNAEARLSAQHETPPHAVATLDAYTIENIVPLD
jgi:hypothetical protein